VNTSRLLLAATAAAGLAAIAAACESTATLSTGPSPVKCQVALSMATSTVAGTGGASAVVVSTEPECAWTATTDATWISSLTPVAGQGNGQVAFSVPANPLPTTRQADIVINDTRMRVQQEPGACRFEIAPANRTIDAGGGTQSIALTTRRAA
jgi:hypothetical protein